MSKFAITVDGVLGTLSQFPMTAAPGVAGKWQFLPRIQNRPSRKAWDTPQAALPRWARSAVIVDVISVRLAEDQVRHLRRRQEVKNAVYEARRAKVGKAYDRVVNGEMVELLTDQWPDMNAAVARRLLGDLGIDIDGAPQAVV